VQTAYDALVADLQGEVDSREIRVRQFREKLEINFVDKVLFASGSAEITPKGREILFKVAGVLGKVKDKGIYVVGHTDNVPIHSGLYPSNWELSAARASSVIRYLSEAGGLVPERFTAMGRAFYQPVASNATPEGRQENRRVDVIVAEAPQLFGETGSESMRGTASGPGKTPGGPVAPAPEAGPIRETAPPPPAPEPGPATPAAPAQSAPTPESGSLEPATPASPAKPEAQRPETPGEPSAAAKPEAPAGAAASTPPVQPAGEPAGEPDKPGAEAYAPHVANPFAAQPETPGAGNGPAGGETKSGESAPALPPPLPDRPGGRSPDSGS